MSKNRNSKLKFEKRSKTEISSVSVLNFPFMYYILIPFDRFDNWIYYTTEKIKIK